MTRPATVLNAISWQDLCPWLILFRAIAIALRPSILLLAFTGLLLSPFGWWVGSQFLSPVDVVGQEFTSEVDGGDVRLPIRKVTFWDTAGGTRDWLAGSGPLQVFGKLTVGPLRLLDYRINIRQFFYYFTGSLWTLMIWSILGTMICRIAAAHFTRDERIGVFESWQFVRRRLVSVLVASLFPLAIMVAFAVPLMILGLLLMMDFMLIVIGAVWFVILLIGLFMAVILIPVFFGYPFIWPAIATDGSDAFETASSIYSYPTQRPYHYAFYWSLILLIGIPASMIANLFGTRTTEFVRWGTSWGAGGDRIVQIDRSSNQPETGTAAILDEFPSDAIAPDSELFQLGVGEIRFWENGLRILVTGFNWGFFLVASTGVYLLLRRDTDQTELDELLVEQWPDELPLPELETPGQALPKQLQEDSPGKLQEDTQQRTPESESAAERASDPGPSNPYGSFEPSGASEASGRSEPPIPPAIDSADDDEQPRLEEE